jgi:hypothetical protein
MEMFTPYTLRRIARWLRPHKLLLWISATVGLALVVIPFSLIALQGGQSFLKIPMALGVFVIVASWGMICIEAWFSERPPGLISRKLQNAFPRLYASGKIVIEWYASVFLVLWFTAGLVMAVAFLIKF